jgi:hypothetical protein
MRTPRVHVLLPFYCPILPSSPLDRHSSHQISRNYCSAGHGSLGHSAWQGTPSALVKVCRMPTCEAQLLLFEASFRISLYLDLLAKPIRGRRSLKLTMGSFRQ